VAVSGRILITIVGCGVIMEIVLSGFGLLLRPDLFERT